jgi:hypothetical protein
VAWFSETYDLWPRTAGEATHTIWDGLSQEAKMRRVRVAMGLHRHDAQPDAELAQAKTTHRRVITDCASALLDGQSVESCRSRATTQLAGARRAAVERIDEYAAGPLAPANSRWVLLTKLDTLHRQALAELAAMLSSQA